MYDLIKTLTALLLMPLPLFFGAMALAVVCFVLNRRWLARLWAIGGLSLLFLLSWGPVAERLLLPLETAFPAQETEALQGLSTEIDTIVVLGGGWSPALRASVVGQLQESSAYRILEGVSLWHALDQPQLIVTGTSRREDEPSIASAYAATAAQLGVPTENIVRLDDPTDTAQEAQAVRAYLGDAESTVLLVTSASHMPRSVRHFERAGVTTLAAPTHYLTGRSEPGHLAYWIPSAQNLRKSERAIYERLGMLAVRWE